MGNPRNILDENTADCVLEAFEKIRGVGGFSEAEALQVLDWAGETVFQNAFLDNVKMGKIGLDLTDDGDVIFVPITPPTLH